METPVLFKEKYKSFKSSLNTFFLLIFFLNQSLHLEKFKFGVPILLVRASKVGFSKKELQMFEKEVETKECITFEIASKVSNGILSFTVF